MAEQRDPLTAERLKVRMEALHRKREARLRERHLEDIRQVLKLASGRRLYWAQLAEAQYFAESFVPGHPDVTAHNEGQRRVGKRLFEDLWAAAPEAFVQMKRENDSEQTQFKIEESNVTQEVERNDD